MTSHRSDDYHDPVLTAEVVRLLVTDRAGAYLDLTAGGGGHMVALARALDKRARLYGLDRDPDAVLHATRNLAAIDQAHQIIRASFGDLTEAIEQFEDKEFAGILLDLGVSSHQIDDPERGFSFREEGPLDMRMDPYAPGTAADLINSADQAELKRILKEYGEERQAARLAGAIVRERQKGMIRTTEQLARIVRSVISGPHLTKSLARVFQAFRIAVNRELDELRSVLPAALSVLTRGGRLAVISYHSLEDRMVKWFFRNEANPPQPDIPFPVPGMAPAATVKIITRRPVTPADNEVAGNPRARSAKLRVGEKL